MALAVAGGVALPMLLFDETKGVPAVRIQQQHRVHHFTADSRSGDTYLFINPIDPYWLQPKRIAEQQYQSGYWSTNQPFHAIYHEIGHLAHYKNSTAMYTSISGHVFDSQDRLIAAKMSSYAIESPREFVAEVFARLATGGAVDADVMMLYASLGGAKL